jgi:hypothetical protein
MSHEIHLGEPNAQCAGCRQAFSVANPPAASVRLSYRLSPLPLFFEYRICGVCAAKLKSESADRDLVLAGINAFHEGDEAKQ